MIKEFKSGKWYRWTGNKERQYWMNPMGEMNFILDGKPHQCYVGEGTNASFYDSPYPWKKWAWYEVGYIEEVPEQTQRSSTMENGTFIIKKKDGTEYRGRLEAVRFEPSPTNPEYFSVHSVTLDDNVGRNPEPFNDGEYLHYTRFHPQLRYMIGTYGWFYDFDSDSEFSTQDKRQLGGVSEEGYPEMTIDGSRWAYFAVPIEQPKTKLTMHEIAEKFGIPVDDLTIEKGEGDNGWDYTQEDEYLYPAEEE